MLAYMINLLPGPGNFILHGINKPHIPMLNSIGAGITNLVLCFALVKLMGYYGVIVGILTTIVVSSVTFISMVHKNIEGLKWDLYHKILVKPVLISAVLGGMLALSYTMYPFKGYLALCTLSLAYFIATSFAMLKGDFFDEFDRATLLKLIPMPKAK